jgi:hypothetical protein
LGIFKNMILNVKIIIYLNLYFFKKG